LAVIPRTAEALGWTMKGKRVRMCFAGGQSLDKMITQYGKAGCPHIGRERIKAGLIKLAE